MPTAPAAFLKASTPVSTVSSMAPMNPPTATPVQSGPYTKAQFQSTMEGSRTIKSSKEIEHLLRDYPAALELYRTGKYKVKVKYDAEVERVILVEKRITKVAANTLPASSTAAVTNENQENNQTVPDLSTHFEENKEVRKAEATRRSRSRTHSQDRAAPTVPAPSGNNIVHTTITSIRMTSNTQPKVDHHRTPSRDREVSVTPPQQQPIHGRSQSRESQYKTAYGKQINREYAKMMVPFVPKPNNAGHLWQQQQQQQQRPQQPYFSNPLLQPQQQRTSMYAPLSFVPQQNPLYRQSYYHGQRPAAPMVYPQQQPVYPPPSARSIGKSSLYSANNYASSIRSVSNTMGLPPTFRTFHSNQQPISPFHLMYPSHVPFPVNHPWANMANEPISALTNNNGTPIEQAKGAKNRARSVDTGPNNIAPARSFHVQPQPAPVAEHHHHHHHHRHRPQPPPTTHVAPTGENRKEPNVPAKEPTGPGSAEKLTVRQLNETFMKADPSGRVSYSSLPALIQRFGITLTENDVVSAAKDLEYNVNDPISARRFVHVLVKLGKITKSTQHQHQPRPPVSPSMLPEDREVTDIMTQHKTTPPHPISSSNQPNQWH